MDIASPTVAEFRPLASETLDTALDKAQTGRSGERFSVILADTAARTEAVQPSDPVAGARETLELDGPTAPGPASEGDLILDGLRKLRLNFDDSTARIDQAMNATSIDAETMLSVQVELVRFSLLTDVTSKLTGKSTQAFDTLMKGQ